MKNLKASKSYHQDFIETAVNFTHRFSILFVCIIKDGRIKVLKTNAINCVLEAFKNLRIKNNTTIMHFLAPFMALKYISVCLHNDEEGSLHHRDHHPHRITSQSKRAAKKKR